MRAHLLSARLMGRFPDITKKLPVIMESFPSITKTSPDPNVAHVDASFALLFLFKLDVLKTSRYETRRKTAI